ncbi:internal scaffolding protein [Microviridae sp.]|nr:internal scaffolding protein [Microviridae sp.]
MSQKLIKSAAKRRHPRNPVELLEYDEKTEKMVPAKSMTDQSFKKETDINLIIKKQINVPTPENVIFADTTIMSDFQQQSDMIANVHEQFDRLPADLRYKFQNDPANLLEYMGNPENIDESIKLGLRPSAGAPPIEDEKPRNPRPTRPKTPPTDTPVDDSPPPAVEK